jgi:ADP-ribose pyrophosphatase
VKPDDSRVVYDGSLIDVAVERWGSHEREIVEHPGSVAILAVDAQEYVWLVRQLREPARKELVELPAGGREPGEEPLATAKRELQEECGLTGGEWRELAGFWTTPGFCREYMQLFLADGVEGVRQGPRTTRTWRSCAGTSTSSKRGFRRSRT